MGWKGMGLVTVLLWGTAVQAQLIVHDPVSYERHVFNSLQNFLQVGQLIIHTYNWTQVLTGFDEGGLGGTFASDINELEGIVGEVQGMLFESQTVLNTAERLFGMSGAPEAAQGLQERLWEIRRLKYERQYRAQQMQTLPQHVSHVVQRLKRLWERIGGILGDKQGFQNSQDMLQQLQLLATQSQVMAAAYQQSRLTDAMEQALIEESVSRIRKARCGRWCE